MSKDVYFGMSELFYQLMAEAKKPYDGVVKHYYPWMPKNAEPNDFYKYSIHKGLNIAKPIHEHFEWLHKYPNPAITGKEKLWLTEYGTKGHIEQQVILQTVINEFPDKVGALLGHSLYLNNNTPMIDDHGVIRSRAYPLAVFSQHSEQFFVETRVQAPTAYEYKKNAIPAVLVTASVDQSRSHLSLVLTNTSPEKSVQVQVQLNGFKPDPKQKVELWKLASTTDKVIDFNSKEKPDAVVLEKVTDLSLSEALAVEVEKAAIYILHFKGTA